MGDTLKKGAVSLKFPAKHRKLGSKAWKQKWIELKSPEKPDEDPRIMTYDCYPFHLSGSKAEPKCIALKNISGIRLTRSRKQEYVCVIDQADKANASAINLPEGQRASKTSLHRISGSSTIMRQFKANSWSQDFTNQDETHSEPFLYVSTWNFTELHSWMTEIRNAIWPPNALHGVSDGFEVSLMDMMGSWQLSDSLRDKYGLLIVEGVTMTLFDPFTGKSHFSWNVLTFSCFDLPQTTWELDKNHIIRGFTTKFHPLGEAEVWMFCKEAESLYSRLERILFEERRLSKEPRCTMTPMMRTSKKTEEETTEQKTRTRTVAFSSTSKDHPPRRHEKLRHRDSGFVAVTASTESLKTHGVHDFPRGSKCPCKITRFMQDESCMANQMDEKLFNRLTISSLNVSKSPRSTIHNNNLLMSSYGECNGVTRVSTLCVLRASTTVPEFPPNKKVKRGSRSRHTSDLDVSRFIDSRNSCISTDSGLKVQ